MTSIGIRSWSVATGCVLAGSTLLPYPGRASTPGGSVCVAPVAEPSKATKSLANPSGGNPSPNYSVQIGRQAPVPSEK